MNNEVFCTEIDVAASVKFYCSGFLLDFWTIALFFVSTTREVTVPWNMYRNET